MSTTRLRSRPAPATEAAEGPGALLLCAHGTRGLAGAAGDHAAALAAAGTFDEVRACALYGDPKLEAALDGLTAARATLVPFLMAEGYTLDVLRRRLAAHPAAARVRLGRAVGAHPLLTDLTAAKADAACRDASWDPATTALLLVGHGTTRHPASAATAEAHASRLRSRTGFAEVATAYLDDDPQVPDALAALAAPRCVAVGFFTDAGDHGREDVPALLAESAVPSVYAGPLGPDAAMREVIRAQALTADGGRVASVTEGREDLA